MIPSTDKDNVAHYPISSNSRAIRDSQTYTIRDGIPSPHLWAEAEQSGASPTLFNHSKQRTNFAQFNQETKTKLINEMMSRGLEKEAQRFCTCGDFVNPYKGGASALMCSDCGHLEPVVSHCNLRICPKCSIDKVNRYKSLYYPLLLPYNNMKVSVKVGSPDKWSPTKLKTIKGKTKTYTSSERYKNQLKLRFMTLTVKNFDDLTSQKVDDLRKAFRRFRRYKEVCKYMYSGLASIEVTEKGTGWHPHFHIIYFGKFFPNKQDSNPKKDRLLTQLWKKACKGLFETEVTDVRSIKDVKSSLNEILKYVGKGSTILDIDKTIDFLQIMKGRRLCSLWGFPEKIGRLPKMACPQCMCRVWTYIPAREVIERKLDFGKLTAYINTAEAFS